MKSLALFDFDGTLTAKDSLADFISFAVGKPRMLFGAAQLSTTLIGYFLGVVNNSQAKQKVLRYFFAGWLEKEMKDISQKYSIQKIPDIIRPKGLLRLSWHLEQGHDVVIVSASPEIWIRPWTDTIGISLIGTRLEFKQGRLTGNYEGKNCNGLEKVNRIKENYNLNEYDMIYGYGDTRGDKPMLGLANEAYYKPFK